MAFLPKNQRENQPRSLTPFHAMEDFMNRWMGDTWPNERLAGMDFSPRVDVNETKDGYEVTAEIPGMKKEDIQVSIEDNHLVLRGEKRCEDERKDKKAYYAECSYGSFLRVIPFGERLDEQNVEARYADGVLHVKLRKSGEQDQVSRRITVQ